MKKIVWISLLLTFGGSAFSQSQEAAASDTSWMHIYRKTATKINDLVHTRLKVSFDYDKAWMYGEAWITLHPQFYPTDSLTLDAKGMDIQVVDLVKGSRRLPLKYTYDSLQLHITLDKTYSEGTDYTLFIRYISRPNLLKEHGSAAITDAKGLYFINPRGTDKNKPIEIWTQGETESNSVWFPTIDKPNQKTTEEIYMTVPAKYVTLSNGLLISQKANHDGTRTDYWRLDLPIAPYLFFMGVGDYAIVHDHYKNIPVDYYVEHKYASVAKKIFGETPAMIGFYSKILGVPYVWPKYDQIVGRDYVSGAMENATATLHEEDAYQNARQLVDGNRWEDDISHELFHHWFGDLVTCESWSNITLNESFADYGETLWDTYRHGQDAGDARSEQDRENYLANPDNETKDLVRFYYKDKEDVFDGVSYAKGGAILNMLRHYVGDSAFFKSLNLYLNKYKFKSTEAQQLRLAFEEVTGKDLNWFWNQWYYGSGQPDLTINYEYQNQQERVIIDQTQKTGKVFKLPFYIDVYSKGYQKKRYPVWVKNLADTFYFPSAQKPSWVNVDAEKILLAKKTDNKGADEFEQQYEFAGNYMDRKEALEYFAHNKPDDLAMGLKDRYFGLRLYTLEHYEKGITYTDPPVLSVIEKMAESDPSKKVQAKAIELLAKLDNAKYQPLFTKFVDDSSYSVAGASLEGLIKLEPDQAYTLAKKYSGDAMGELAQVIASVLAKNPHPEDFPILLDIYRNSPISQTKVQETINFAKYLVTVKDSAQAKEGVDEIMNFRNKMPEQYRKYVDPVFRQMFTRIAGTQRDAGNSGAADYIENLIP
ncbi:MAG: M1 family metallopeptidase [Bacteroidota bacterium]|nr:M1 family metallopeptidase [Bacteroidota bacterium]